MTMTQYFPVSRAQKSLPCGSTKEYCVFSAEPFFSLLKTFHVQKGVG